MKKNISPATKMYGIFGYPVKHSFSPAMHNAAFEKCDINAVYTAFEVAPEVLRKAVDALRTLGISGINVTIPHKETIIPYLDKVDKQAAIIGAVNTVVNRKGKLTGYNSDSYGFSASFEETFKRPLAGAQVLVLGAGGAARAVGAVCAAKKCASLTFADIQPARARRLARDLKKHYPKVDCFHSMTDRVCVQSVMLESDILINATGCGMKKSDPLVVPSDGLHTDLTVCDLIYNPADPVLIRAARKKGCSAMNGLGMLLHQGARAFELWTGSAAPVAVMKKALMAHMGKK